MPGNSHFSVLVECFILSTLEFDFCGFFCRPDTGEKHGKGRNILMPFRDEILTAWKNRRSAREIAEHLADQGIRTTSQNVWKFIQRHTA